MKNLVFIIIAILLSACVSQEIKQDLNGQQLTVGTVQKEIKVGMSQTDVISRLGSPNIVTSGDNQDEVWIYDKISSKVHHSQEGKYVTLLLFGASANQGYASRSQKTLTIIIKFDNKKIVNNIKYHTSRF